MSAEGREASVATIEEIVPALGGMPEWSAAHSYVGSAEGRRHTELELVRAIIDGVTDNDELMSPLYSGYLASILRAPSEISDRDYGALAQELQMRQELAQRAVEGAGLFIVLTKNNWVSTLRLSEEPVIAQHPVWSDPDQLTFNSNQNVKLRGTAVSIDEMSQEWRTSFPDLSDPLSYGGQPSEVLVIDRYGFKHPTPADITKAAFIGDSLLIWHDQVEAGKPHVTEEQLFLMKMGAVLLDRTTDVEAVFGAPGKLDLDMQTDLINRFLECIHGATPLDQMIEHDDRLVDTEQDSIARTLSLADWSPQMLTAALRATGVHATETKTPQEVLANLMSERVRFNRSDFDASARLIGRRVFFSDQSGLNRINKFASDLMYAAGVPARRLQV